MSDSKDERNYGKRLVRTLFDFRRTNLYVQWCLLPSVTNLPRIPKAKGAYFLIGLTLTFLIVASYTLTSNRTGLFPRPGIVSTNTTVEVSSENNVIDMKQLVKIISSKLEYTPRKVPDEKDVIATNSHLFSVIPHHFLPSIKNPCWYEEFSSELSTDLYKSNLLLLEKFKTMYDHMRANFHEHLYHQGGKLFRLRCLPFFYIIGQPKCGTTDLFDRLKLHPEINFSLMKEPHWWTRKRFEETNTVEDYLDLFDLTALNIQKAINENSTGDERVLITGDGSPSTMWDAKVVLRRSQKWIEPPFLAQDFIHIVQPRAKILVILRDPVERLYSDYLYFKEACTVEDFHQRVVMSILAFQSCLSETSTRACVYSKALHGSEVRLTLGMYIVFLLDWLTVFHRDQILVIRLEDYSANLKVTIQNILDFLTVGPMSAKTEKAMIKKSKANTRTHTGRAVGPMLPSTRDLLREFYQPFNNKLASVLDNKAFLWSET